MPTGPVLVAFVAATLMLLLIPGPSVLYIVTRSLTQGRSAGLLSVFGISVGHLVHATAATIGISALLAQSVAALTTIKLLGAGYLLFLGLRTILTKSSTIELTVPEPRSRVRIFIDGIVVNVFNPKPLLFYLVVLPQFADPHRGPVAPQLAVLGLIVVSLNLCVNGGYALLAGVVRHQVLANSSRSRLPRYVAGGIYSGIPHRHGCSSGSG